MPDLQSRWGKLPKVDLHRHLEGSIRLATLIDIAREHHIELPPGNLQRYVQVGKGEQVGSQQFLGKFKFLRRFYRSPEAIDRIAYEAVADAAEDHVRYLELRFSPQALAAEQDFSLSDVTDWVIAAVQRAQRDFPITVQLIVSIVRHDPLPLAERAVQVAASRVGKGIIALDLTGDETEFPPEPFVSLFCEARQAGLHITAHAGEWTGGEMVAQVIERFQAERIGHGIHTLEHPQAAHLVRERQVPLELCLTSNLQTGAVPDLSSHPIRDLVHADLPVTINSDDPCVSNCTLTDEFVLAIRSIGLTEAELEKCMRTSIRASFLPDAEKAKLAVELEQALEQSRWT